MSDIKLFRLSDGKASEITGETVALERALQNIFEQNLYELLGIRFLASEYDTSSSRRPDTLGLDDDNSPVIIEYKRRKDENIINQGISYLDWLMDNQADFKWLVMDRFGKGVADKINFSAPRLLCVASAFTKFDEKAIKRINISIELIRYRYFTNDSLMLEFLTPTTSKARGGGEGKRSVEGNLSLRKEGAPGGKYGAIAKATPELRGRLDALRDLINSLGEDVREEQVENYIGFKSTKIFAKVQLRPSLGTIILDLRGLKLMDVISIRDIAKETKRGVRVKIGDGEDVNRIKPCIRESYERSIAGHSEAGRANASHGITEKIRTLFDEGRGITDNKEMLERLTREGVQFHLPTVQTQMSRLRRKHGLTRTR
ncbi:MAG: DUF5655 domain-containing protein [Alphaproteobacteria bacterium]|nr:DUF5655 domain-containing protein [Alphaproteobacteria bacterium]MDA8005687.1 DUF5655 domain-containing protein [Alphaproteobacteria bacterium]MDA8013068.1 DUF5655 domain-containing protein [Alphaproteobacteria bacterium]